LRHTIEHILSLQDTEPENLESCKLLNTELKRGAEFLKSILLAIPDDVLIIDENRIIIWSNRDCFDNKSLKDCPLLFSNMNVKTCPMKIVFEKCKTVQFQTRVEDIFYLNTIAPCNYNGHVSTVLMLRRDISEIKKIEEFRQLEMLVNQVAESNERLSKMIKEKG
jgi:transcriptional regulator with PAS, ATPase and Fis domain